MQNVSRKKELLIEKQLKIILQVLKEGPTSTVLNRKRRIQLNMYFHEEVKIIVCKNHFPT